MSNIWLICPLWGHQDFLLKTMYHFFPWVQAKHHKNSQPIPRFLSNLIWVGPKLKHDRTIRKTNIRHKPRTCRIASFILEVSFAAQIFKMLSSEYFFKNGFKVYTFLRIFARKRQWSAVSGFTPHKHTRSISYNLSIEFIFLIFSLHLLPSLAQWEKKIFHII